MLEEIRLPEIAENVASGEIVRVVVSKGDIVKKDQPLVEIETEKASFDIPSPRGGKIVDVAVKNGDTVTVGQTICTMETEAEAPAATRETPTPPPVEQKTQPAREPPASPSAGPTKAQRPLPPPEPAAGPRFEPIPAAPSVRREARELGIDIRLVPGSGPGGRTSSDDVKRYAKQAIAASRTDRALPNAPERELPDFSRWGEVERTPMSKVRLLTAERLLSSWTSIPHVTHTDKADITEVESFRKRYAPRIEKAGGKLTITAIMVKIAALALKKFPIFNASADFQNNEIIYKKYVHIGIAVDTGRGLLVPVIRDADTKNLAGICAETSALAEKTRAKAITPDEMKGATFTISNLGGIGGAAFTPIIDYPQVAILGIVRAKTEPVYADDDWIPRLFLPLSLSYDHRIIDGADGARFMRWIIDALQDPLWALLEGGV